MYVYGRVLIFIKIELRKMRFLYVQEYHLAKRSLVCLITKTNHPKKCVLRMKMSFY